MARSKGTTHQRLLSAVAALVSKHASDFDVSNSLPRHWEMYGDFAMLPSDAFTEPAWSAVPAHELWQAVAVALQASPPTAVALQASLPTAALAYSRPSL